MPLPVLQLFGVGILGCQKPVDDPPVVIPTYDERHDFYRNAMPLVPARSFAGYEAEEAKFGALGIGSDERNQQDVAAPKLSFARYTFEHKYSSPQNVYPIVPCYLYWLHDGKSNPNLLNGCVLNSGESILVLKPIPKQDWEIWHPAKTAALTECVYLNVALDETQVRSLIKKTTTEAYHRRVYKVVTKTDAPQTPDWDVDYFNLFKTHPEVPIIVNTVDFIGATTGSDISIYFKIGDQWTDHDNAVQSFFRFFRRNDLLIGHPMISMLLGHISVRSATVDLIRFESFSDGSPLWQRPKANLLLDYYKLRPNANAEYHPLALNCEEDPNRVAISKAPTDAILPIPNLDIGNNNFITKLKINNPLALQLDINGYNAAHVNVSIANLSATEHILSLSAGIENVATTPLTISTDGDVISNLNLTFFEFKMIPVKFHLLTDYDQSGTALHSASINEAMLQDSLLYANDILGRQANTYIVPILTNDGKLLHELAYQGNLGDPISSENARKVTKQVFETVAGSENKKVNIIFVWSMQKSTGDTKGVTISTITYEDPDDASTPMIAYAQILINTTPVGIAMGAKEIGQAMVHELGHWHSFVFEYFDNVKNHADTCSGIVAHFMHGPGGCEGGDLEFYSNLMMNGGGYFISYDQAVVFNSHATEILP